MSLRIAVQTGFLVVLGFLGVAPPVEAQEAAFLAIVGDLAATPGGVAHDRMTASLAEWDRQLDALEAQLTSQAAGPGSERSFQLHIELAVAYRRRGRLDGALRHFDAAASLQPANSDVHVLRALTLEAAGNIVEGSQAFRAAWVRDVASPVKAYLVLQRTRNVETGDRERARDILRAAYDRILSGEQRSPAAPPFLTLDLVPDAFSPTPIAGEARLARVFSRLAAGRLDEAAAALLDRDSSSSPDDSALERIARAQAAEREGRLSDARREYVAALDGTLAGRHALYVGIARLAQVEGELGAAVDAFAHAVRLSPNNPVLRREFAAALVAADRFDEAFAELVAALLIAPGDADVLAAMGQMFLDTDRATEAIAPLRRALAMKADRYETHYALAVALSRAGQADEAAREFERFERLSRQALQDRRRVMTGQAGLNETQR